MTAARARLAAALAGISAVAALLAYQSDTTWDYPDDAGPAIDHLINGRWSDFLEERPAMGPVSLLLRAPFAALSRLTGEGGPTFFYEDAYRFGVFPSVVAAGILGLVLARIAAERGQPRVYQFALVALCLVNPLALRAIHFGHPEEILAAVFVVGAMVAALGGRQLAAVVLLTLGVLTKQWAVLAVIPVALVMDRAALRRGALVLVGGAVVLTAPLLAANPGSFVDATRGLLDLRSQFVTPTNIWWPFTEQLPDLRSGYHGIPGWLGTFGHTLVIVVGVAVALVLAPRVRFDPVAHGLPLLALVLLLRSILDPVNNSYYHVPFFTALVAAAAYRPRLLALLASTAVPAALTYIAMDAAVLNAVYLAWTLPLTAYLAVEAGAARRRAAA